MNEVNKALYAALCMLRDEPEKRMPNWGICWNIDQMTKHLRLEPEMRKLVRDKFVEIAGEWPATKDKRGTYPVEGDFQVYDAHQRALTLWDNPRRIELLEWATQKAEAGPPIYVWPDLSYIEVSEYNENEFRHKGDDFWRLDHPIYHEVMAPYFPNAYTEHVNVLVGSRYTDMFVDEDGLTKRLPRNEKATAIYRNNWLTQHPNTDPEMMAFIVGPAVVFSDRVWY